jgi:hypothetical protein
MRFRVLLVSAVFAGAAALAVGQDRSTTTETKQTAVQNPDGSSVTITGEVVRYEPGKTIVIRRSNNAKTTYTLDSSAEIPSDIAVGRQVTLVTKDGTIHVRKITTVILPEGSSGSMSSMSEPPKSEEPKTAESVETRQTTETRSTASVAPAQEPPASTQEQTTRETATTKVTTVSGTVQAYEPGQSITIVGPDKKVTTYTISEGVQAPQTVAVGKKVTFTTTTVSGKPAVQSFTTTTKTTKTTKTKTKTVSPQ